MFGIYPNNIELYKLALIHKSASVFLDDGTPINNERLEFLGDAVIETIISEMLYIEFPYESEGFLTQLRSKIVSRISLNDLAVQIGLDRHLISQYSLNHTRKHLFGDAFEAVIGAIYLDKGYDFTNRLLINRIIKPHIDLNDLLEKETDFKSRLIEWCQQQKKELVIVSDNSEFYTVRNPHFISSVKIDGQLYGQGGGASKKEAEQLASRLTISTLEIKPG